MKTTAGECDTLECGLATLEAPEWEYLAVVDPLLRYPDRARQALAVNDYLSRKESEISHLMQRIHSFGRPSKWDTCLDFACGVGATTRALAKHFRHACGVDISQNRVRQAKEINRDLRTCDFVCAAELDEHLFPDDSFDLVLARNFLHNLPSKAIIETFLRNLIRVLKPDGILLFSMPVSVSPWRRLIHRRQLWRILRALGLPRDLLNRVGLSHMRSQVLSEDEIAGMVDAHGARICGIEPFPSARFGSGVSLKMFFAITETR